MVGAAVVFLVLAQAPAGTVDAGGISSPGAPQGGGKKYLPRPAAEEKGLPLVFHEDFSSGEKALPRFEYTDPKAWRIEKDGERTVLSQFAASEYVPAVRSPFNIAWIRDLKVGQFIYEVKLRSTVQDYGHRDLCLFFGGVDASHFFYVHLGKEADPHSNSIFKVDGQPRVSVATRRTDGTPWDDSYHLVRIVREESGRVEVFWDGKSVMVAEDKSFPIGRLGVGSFDDKGNFATLTVWGKKAE
jgi:hypothetical protein